MLYPDFKLLSPEEIIRRDALNIILRKMWDRNPSSENEAILFAEQENLSLSDEYLREQVSLRWRLHEKCKADLLTDVDNMIFETLDSIDKSSK